MTELDQLMKRIDKSGLDGVETEVIREDYEPAGQLMINNLCATGKYITRKVPASVPNQKWKIFKKGMEPY